MRAELRWTPKAQQDLVDLYISLWAESPPAAEWIIESLHRRAEALTSFPRLGRRYPSLAQYARILVHGNYLLLYETSPDSDSGPVSQVDIVRVIDGRRDLKRI